MADDPNPELRAELMAALAVLAPQIRGLHDLDGVSISEDLKAEVVTLTGVSEDINVTLGPSHVASVMTLTLGAPADKVVPAPGP